MSITGKIIAKRLAKWSCTISLCLFLLILSTWIYLQTNSGKDFVKKQVVSYLRNKLHAEVDIGSVETDWFNRLSLHQLYLKDQQQRILLSAEVCQVRYSLIDILHGKLNLSLFDLRDAQVNLFRGAQQKDFNFSFVINAFAGKSTGSVAESSPFNIKSIHFKNTSITIDDIAGGQQIYLYAGTVDAVVKEMNAASLLFKLNFLRTDSIISSIITTDKISKETGITNATIFPHIAVENILLKHTQIHYTTNGGSRFALQSSIDSLQASEVDCNMSDRSLSVAKMMVKNQVSIVHYSASTHQNKPVNLTTSAEPFTYTIKQALISNNCFSYDDESAVKKESRYIDYHHFALQEGNLDLRNSGFDGKEYFGDIHNLSGKERSGFELQELHAQLQFSDTGFTAKDCFIKTNQSEIHSNINLSYSSFHYALARANDTKVNVDIRNSNLAIDELVEVTPSLTTNQNVKPLLGKTFFVNTSISGVLNKLYLPSLLIKQNHISLSASAWVFNLPDLNRLQLQLNIHSLVASRRGLRSLLSSSLLSDSLLLYIPETLTLRGKYGIAGNDISADGALQSNWGNLLVQGFVNNSSDTHKAKYNLAVKAQHFQLQKLLHGNRFGEITFDLQAQGEGYSLTGNKVLTGTVQELAYNGYTYQNITVNSSLEKDRIKWSLQSADANANGNVKGYYDMASKSISANALLNRLSLYKLGYVSDSFTVSGHLDADIDSFDTARPEGTLNLQNVTIQRVNANYHIDSITIAAKHEDDNQTIQLQSPFAKAVLTGQYSLPGMFTSLKSLTNYYLYKNNQAEIFSLNTNAELTLSLSVPDTLLSAIPGLKRLDSLQLAARINSKDSLFRFNGMMGKLEYSDFKIDSFYVGVNPVDNAMHADTLTFSTGFKKLTSSSLQMADIQTKGLLSPGTVQGNITEVAANGLPSYSIDYALANDSVSPYLRLGSSLIINEKKWTVNQDNVIYIKKEKVDRTNVSLSNGAETLHIFSRQNSDGDTMLIVAMKDFSLQNISNLINTDSGYAEGSVDGNIEIRSFAPFLFEGHVTADSLRVKNILIGDVKADVTSSDSTAIRGDITITGENKGTLQTVYNPLQETVQAEADIDNINLHSAEPFLQPLFENVKGSLQGNVAVSGSLASPVINSTLRIKNVGLLYREYATYISIPDAPLQIDSNRLLMDGFTFTDSAGNKGFLSGNIIKTSDNEVQCDVKVTAHNFTAIGRKLYPEQTVYGVTKINTSLSMIGNVMRPDITGDISVVDGSHITYIYSNISNNSSHGAGLISFFNPFVKEEIDSTKEKPEESTSFEPVINVSVSLTPKTTTTIISDELSGDHISISGTSSLYYASNRNGQTTLTGNYVAESGTYDLSIGGALRREFTIQKGSTIQWSGDLQKPLVDITALYKVKTTAAELLSGSETVSGADRQKLDFEVNLFLKNNLLHPDISFKIDMPKSEQAVFNGIIYTRIKQVNDIPSELNKQVMSLLVLNGFVADNPFSSFTGSNSSFSTTLYNTAGDLVTHELNNLIGKAIKWVDINVNFDMNEDYTTGAIQRQTNLKINISKSLIHNRLFLYIGNSVVIDNHEHNTNPFAGLAGDVSGEYLVTADGRYRIKAYRMNENSLAFQGSVVKTGVTFVMVIQLSRLREFFKRPEKISD